MTFTVRFLLAVSLLLVTSTNGAADLFDALNNKDVEGAAAMLKADPTLANKPDANGNPPLHFALCRNNIKIIQLLVDAGAEVNALDSNGFSPMHHAATNKNKAVIELLIAHHAKIDVTARNLDGWTPLHCAASAGNKPILALLLDKGARIDGGIIPIASEPNASEPRTTPLYDAVKSGHFATAEYLLAKGANPIAKGSVHYSPLDKAVENRDLDLIRLLLANGAGSDSEIAFPRALQSGDRELVEVFLKHGIDVKNPRYLITAAAWSKELTELLLDKGANPRGTLAQGYSPLMSAASSGRPDVVALLLARGASVKDVDAGNQTALHFASNAAIAELLLTSGADVNATTRDGATPMHTALLHGQKDHVELLAKRGAKLDAFSMAALGRADELRTYLKDNPIPRPPNQSLRSALHLAARFGQNETLAVLLDKGADIESRTRDGLTPLHVAAECGQKATVAFLLKKGADINATTSDDTFGPRSQTPLQLALAAGQTKVVRLLVDKGRAPETGG